MSFHNGGKTQTVFSLAKLTGLLDRLRRKQRLALFLAALCHDIEHPGVSSAFLLKSRSTMAALYKNDPGLLEKHHSIRAFELLISKDLGLLRNLPTDDRVNVRHLVRDLILATDMARHSEMCEQLRRLADADCGEGVSVSQDSEAAPALQAELRADGPAAPGDHPPPPFQAAFPAPRPTRPPPRLLLHMQALLKCADISNVAKPLPVAMEWAVAVSDEFFAQGDLERAQGIEVRLPSPVPPSLRPSVPPSLSFSLRPSPLSPSGDPKNHSRSFPSSRIVCQVDGNSHAQFLFLGHARFSPWRMSVSLLGAFKLLFLAHARFQGVAARGPPSPAAARCRSAASCRPRRDTVDRAGPGACHVSGAPGALRAATKRFPADPPRARRSPPRRAPSDSESSEASARYLGLVGESGPMSLGLIGGGSARRCRPGGAGCRTQWVAAQCCKH